MDESKKKEMWFIQGFEENIRMGLDSDKRIK
jgi:hypothetical protein